MQQITVSRPFGRELVLHKTSGIQRQGRLPLVHKRNACAVVASLQTDGEARCAKRQCIAQGFAAAFAALSLVSFESELPPPCRDLRAARAWFLTRFLEKMDRSQRNMRWTCSRSRVQVGRLRMVAGSFGMREEGIGQSAGSILGLSTAGWSANTAILFE